MGFSLGGSKSKSKNKQAQQSTSTTTLDPWSKGQFENQTAGILDLAKNYAAQPFKAYNGQMVAGMSSNEQKAGQMAQDGSGAGGVLNDAVQSAKDGAAMQWTPEGVLGPDKVNYRTFDADRVRQRYNPYEKDVVDATGAYYDEQLGKRMSENQAAATQSGAYGGSRHGVADAELQRTSNMDRTQVMSDLRYKGWNDAVAGDTGESDRLLSTDQYNSANKYQAALTEAQRKDAAAQFGINQKFTASGVLSGLASQKDASHAQQIDQLAKSGATSREIEQATLLAQRAEFDREAKDQLDKLLLELQTRQGILGSTPMGQTTTSSGTATSKGTTSGLSFGFKS